MEERRRLEKKGESQLDAFMSWKQQKAAGRMEPAACYPVENIKLPKTQHEPLFLSLCNKFLAVLKCTPLVRWPAIRRIHQVQ